ncbi:MAG: type II toxin-antitoxin system RelE/ParE family toxin [Alphaproteobacteria bacterium]|nr:type II toxin-antitoxin system RelE/ParE family toxin [Alphaproteobacteria bacterium]
MTEVVYSNHARKSLKKIPENYQGKIVKVINVDLKANPYQNEILKNSQKYRRHKNNILPYRIIYRVRHNQEIEILNIVLIGHRKDVYDKLKRIKHIDET